ncbi:TlpA disulfide reductase family protein [Desulfonatronum lacustre]|uniref:TlpA disulfide reductase family protein n=1 Tax=Desulfonatronum lacustre TaxID=66849 RepID=UPI0004B59A72|nr:TlpA disulfide reductase family protein [Desulfonatronum lacustre]
MKKMLLPALLLLALVASTPFRACWANEVERTDDLPVMDVQGFFDFLREQRGKVVVVDFWATWCGPCRKKLPALMACRDSFSEEEVAMLGISLDFNPATLRSFLKVNQLNYPIFLAEDGLGAELGVGAIPLLHVYDAAGALVIVEEGLTSPETLCQDVGRLITP